MLLYCRPFNPLKCSYASRVVMSVVPSLLFYSQLGSATYLCASDCQILLLRHLTNKKRTEVMFNSTLRFFRTFSAFISVDMCLERV